MTRGRWSLLGLALALPLAVHCGGDSGATLHVLVWTDYLVPDVNAEFERETGAQVVEANFSSNEELRAKLQAGALGYDLVCPTDYMIAQLVRDGLLLELDLAKIPNVQHLSERFRAPPYDPQHRHSVPYQWGVTGIGFRKSDVSDAPTSWDALFGPESLEKYGGRISMLNDVRETLGAALIWRGKSPNSRDEAEIRAAGEALLAQKPHLAKYDSDTFGDSLVARETVIAHGWGGTFSNAQTEDPEIAFVVPREGTLAYVDNWAIPRGARHKDLAERFIDFLHRPEIAARVVNERRYASCNEAARKSIDPAILASASYADGGGAKLWWLEDVGDAAKHYERAWLDVKSGQ